MNTRNVTVEHLKVIQNWNVTNQYSLPLKILFGELLLFATKYDKSRYDVIYDRYQWPL